MNHHYGEGDRAQLSAYHVKQLTARLIVACCNRGPLNLTIRHNHHKLVVHGAHATLQSAWSDISRLCDDDTAFRLLLATRDQLCCSGVACEFFEDEIRIADDRALAADVSVWLSPAIHYQITGLAKSLGMDIGPTMHLLVLSGLSIRHLLESANRE